MQPTPARPPPRSKSSDAEHDEQEEEPACRFELRELAGRGRHSEEVTVAAVKGVIALQLAEEMQKKKPTKKRLAELMKMSRA